MIFRGNSYITLKQNIVSQRYSAATFSLGKNIPGQPWECNIFNWFFLLLFFEATNYFFERKFEEESLKVTKVTKKNLFKEKRCQRKFYTLLSLKFARVNNSLMLNFARLNFAQQKLTYSLSFKFAHWKKYNNVKISFKCVFQT